MPYLAMPAAALGFPIDLSSAITSLSCIAPSQGLLAGTRLR
jgi:hypothetical protein